MKAKEIMLATNERHGIDKVLNKATEEMGELLVAINKHRNYPDEKKWQENIAEEIAHVQIMCERLTIMLGNKKYVKQERKKKLTQMQSNL